jgi:hypothetical protein
MQGELAQLISLTSFGNEYLESGDLPFFYPEHTTFRFCRVIDFHVPKGNGISGSNDLVWAENPLQWFQKLKQSGCIGLRLFYQPADPHPLAQEHQLVGFVGGGGRWLIEAKMKDNAQYWLKRWALTDKQDPENKIWSVHYLRVEEKAPIVDQQYDVDEVKNELDQVLGQLIQFCQQQQLPQWKSIFEKGNNILSGTIPLQKNSQADLLVHKNYSAAAQQLLSAINETWVFGGMGSWNDISFEEARVQKEYDDLSERLYALMMKGIVAAVNS